MRPYPRFGANDGNRTHNRSLGSCCFTTKLHSHYSRSLCPGKQDPPLQRLFYHKRAKGQPFLRKLPRRDPIRELIELPYTRTLFIPANRGTGLNPKKCPRLCLRYFVGTPGSSERVSASPTVPVGRTEHRYSFLFSRQLGTGLPWYALRATSHTPVPTWLVGMDS